MGARMSEGHPKSPFAPGPGPRQTLSVAPQARTRRAIMEIPCFDFAELRFALDTNGWEASG